MNRVLLSLFCLSCVLLLLSSCEEKTVDPNTIDTGSAYYPLEVGKYRDYAVDSTTYEFDGTGATLVQSRSYQVRELLSDTFTDNTGRIAYRVERYERNSFSDPWTLIDVWSTVQDQSRSEQIEENRRFVKMIYPAVDGDTWDGNQHFDSSDSVEVAGELLFVYENWLYRYDGVGTSFSISGQVWPDVTRVVQVDSENLIEKRFSEEIYARGVGMVYKEQQILDTQCGGNLSNCIGQPWEDIAEKGYILKMELIDTNW